MSDIFQMPQISCSCPKMLNQCGLGVCALSLSDLGLHDIERLVGT